MAVKYLSFDSAPVPLRDFLTYISTIRNLSVNTVNGYFTELRTFLRFIVRHKFPSRVPADASFEQTPIFDVTYAELDSVTTTDVYEYLHFVMDARDNKANSRARKLAALRTFYKYMNTKVYKIKNDPVKDIDTPAIRKTLPKFLSLGESENLLDSVSKGDFFERDYCIITLFLNCGMRLSELVGINVKDISDATIRIVGKGNKERMVYLNEACLEAIRAYLARRADFASPSEPNALFITRRGTRISPRRVEQIVEQTLKNAELDDRGFSAHKLRHTAATLMYRYGEADMLALKEILGHEHVSTTEIYTHISDEQLKKAATSSPLSGKKPKND